MCYDRRSLKKGVIGSMILQQICVLLGVCLVGEAVSSLLPFAFPASVIAMVLLLVLLFSGLVKPKHLGQTGNFLLDNMALFFVPSCTSIVKYLDVLLENLTAYRRAIANNDFPDLRQLLQEGKEIKEQVDGR